MIESKKIKNPFPGLRPFETDEYRLFFGREGQSDALIARLRNSHFLAVVGTSGSGKSSLVRAGLLPALRGGLMEGAGSGWRIAIMRPGSDPIGNLALALAEKGVLLEAGGSLPPAEAGAVIEATLRYGSLGLVEVARQARLAETEKLLVVVDQFEELFRFRAACGFSSAGDDAAAFVKLLLEASQQRELSIYVVPTMRSDFLGDCAQFQGLPEAINEGQYLIPRMTRDERRFAITGPVGVTRGKITEPLVNRLMNDVGDNPDQLPILQHALMRTWDYWAAHQRDREPIGMAHYLAIGGMTDALSQHADEAFNALPKNRQLIAEVIFRSLTERGADNREIRRPTYLKEICEIAEASQQEVIAVIDVFRDRASSFLMPPTGVALESETVIDISHESLIRNWRRLQDWVKDEAESARIYRRLAEAATDYHAGMRGLLDDVTLQYVLKWRDKANPCRAWGVRYHSEFDDAMGYLEESRVASEARLAAEHERERRELETARAFAEKQARAARRLRWASVAMALLFVLALGGAAYAFRMKQRAEASQEEATEQKRIATALLEKEKGTTKQLLSEQSAKEAALEDARTKAVIAKSEADKAQKEKERANAQTRIAAANLKKAVIAQRTAEENAKEIVEAGKRDQLLRLSIQASRQEEHTEALRFLQELQEKLRAIQPGASTSSSNPRLTRERAKQLAMDLGWTLSDIGAIYQEEKNYKDAVTNYEEALGILNEILPANSDNPILFDTYHGLAHSYHAVARRADQPTRKIGVSVPSYDREDLEKAEDFFKKALAFQQQHRANKPSEVAKGYLNLARLYNDLHDYSRAKEYYELAIGLLKENNIAEAEAALREFALFHRNAGRYEDAEKVYKELITSQEDITIFEFAEKGQAIANVYTELADVYRADGKPNEANDVFRVADLIQKVSLKLKRNDDDIDLKLDADLDDMGDAYIKLGKFSDAEVLYKQALDYRRENPEKQRSLWKSYDKLTKLYRENIGDVKKAEEYNFLLLEFFKNNKDGSNGYVDSMVQLAALYMKDDSRFAEAESLYQRALEAALTQDDWQYPNLILYQLGQLYFKMKKVPEREQAIRQRLETLTRFFNRLGDSGRRPRAPINLTSEYLNAVEAAAVFQATVRKDNAGAEAAYKPAFAAFEYITGNVYNSKVLETYASTLDRYQTLLNNQNKPDESVKVGEKIKVLREKLGQVDKIYNQNSPSQAQAMTSQSAQ